MAVIPLIGLAGHIGSGKTTIANWLVTRHGFVAIGFADALKEEVIRCFPKLLALEAQYWHGDAIAEGLTTLERAIEQIVWVQKPPRVRLLLQEFGTEVRRGDDPEYWVRRWERKTQPRQRSLVAPDVRFISEIRAIQKQKGRLIQVIRPGHEGDAHQSERDLDGWNDWDHVVRNTGTIKELQAQVDHLIEAR